MTFFYLTTGLFILTMAANVVALVRHWRMMRVMTITMSNLAETQRLFNELQQSEVARRLPPQNPLPQDIVRGPQ